MGNILAGILPILVSYRPRPRKEQTIILIGLDYSGKTTLLTRLKNPQQNVLILPTEAFNLGSIPFRKNTLTIWDLAGGPKTRLLWRHYFAGKQAIVFVIDANDPVRLYEAVEILKNIADYPELIGVPFLIFANKSDFPSAMSVEEISAELPPLPTHQYYVQACSAETLEGVYEGLTWLLNLKKNK